MHAIPRGASFCATAAFQVVVHNLDSRVAPEELEPGDVGSEALFNLLQSLLLRASFKSRESF